eukprot:3041351-Prymnesium_polylepis.1
MPHAPAPRPGRSAPLSPKQTPNLQLSPGCSRARAAAGAYPAGGRRAIRGGDPSTIRGLPWGD